MKAGAILATRQSNGTVLYTVKCVGFDHGDLSTPELSDIAWSHFDYQIKTLLFG